MLEQASARGVYDEIHVGELTAFMRSHPAAFDIVVAADVLCYFGKLDEAVHGARCTLRPGGMLCFSVEALLDGGEEDFRIQLHGRYSHALAYLERTVVGAGFGVPQIEAVILRKEFAEPVHGYVVLAPVAEALK
jgi:predicted TPR repeat methyltransferase